MSGEVPSIHRPSPTRVRAVVGVDRDTGFFWKERCPSEFVSLHQWRSWTAKNAGKAIAIKRASNGYSSVRIDGVHVALHRLIWVLHYGEWPKFELDHINGNIADNRIENLRDVTASENRRNQALRSDNTSGCPGVVFRKHRRARPWAVQICVEGRRQILGNFSTREEAIACRQREQARFGFTDRHGSRREISQ